MKTCTQCGQSKDESEFYFIPHIQRYRAECKKCNNARCNAYRRRRGSKDNPHELYEHIADERKRLLLRIGRHMACHVMDAMESLGIDKNTITGRLTDESLRAIDARLKPISKGDRIWDSYEKVGRGISSAELETMFNVPYEHAGRVAFGTGGQVQDAIRDNESEVAV